MAFFPNYIKRRYQLKKQAETRKAFPQENIPEYSEILNIFRQENILWEPHLFLHSNEILYTDELANDVSYKICTNIELRKVLMWISKRILSTLGIDNYLSINVYIRIGTSMLNNLVEQGCITKSENIYIHDNLVRNVSSLLSELNTENLPF